jgi:23S rRNA pseudouridine1911/1915/1917 synthase
VPIKGSRVDNARDLLNQALSRRRQKAIIVHRIDRYTSGLMVFAKHERAHAHLVRQFLAHTPVRVYLALVRGRPEPPEGELRHYLKLTSRGFRQAVVSGESEGGTLAVTRYRVEEAMPGASLLEIHLVTGLKNQIRVQLAAAGTPIVGDRHYVEAERKVHGLDHQALHAHCLGFRHPGSDRYVEFRADPPQDFLRALASLRHGLPRGSEG